MTKSARILNCLNIIQTRTYTDAQIHILQNEKNTQEKCNRSITTPGQLSEKSARNPAS